MIDESPIAFARMRLSCWIAPAGFWTIAWIFVAMSEAMLSRSPRLWLISGSWALSTLPIGVLGWFKPLTKLTISSSACVIQPKSRFWNFEKTLDKSGPR